MKTCQPSLPANRAFVVQFRMATHGQAQAGRVEHILSGQTRHFESAEQLVAFMEQIMIGVLDKAEKEEL